MKLNNIELQFDNFAAEMAKLKNEKHFDYLVTIIGEDLAKKAWVVSIFLRIQKAMNVAQFERLQSR